MQESPFTNYSQLAMSFLHYCNKLYLELPLNCSGNERHFDAKAKGQDGIHPQALQVQKDPTWPLLRVQYSSAPNQHMGCRRSHILKIPISRSFLLLCDGCSWLMEPDSRAGPVSLPPCWLQAWAKAGGWFQFYACWMGTEP